MSGLGPRPGGVIGDDLSQVPKQVGVAGGAVVHNEAVDLIVADGHVVRLAGVVCDLGRAPTGDIVDNDSVMGLAAPGLPASIRRRWHLRGAAQRQGQAKNPGPWNGELRDPGAWTREEGDQDLHGILVLLAGGSQHACQDLLGGGPAPREVAAPALAVDHRRADGPFCLMIRRFDAGEDQEAEEGFCLSTQMLH